MSSSSGYVPVPGAKIFYTVQGPAGGGGTPIILIHGWTADQTDWSFQLSPLLSHGCKVITLDLRGHGRSLISSTDPAATADMSMETLADDCAAVLSHLGIVPTSTAGGGAGERGGAIAIGHSMGAVVVDQLAASHPGLVRGKVLVDPSWCMTVEMMDGLTAAFEGDGKESNQNDFKSVIGPFFEGAYTPSTPAWMRDWHKIRAWGMDPVVAVEAFRQLKGYLGDSGAAYLRGYKEKEKRNPKFHHGIPRLVFGGREAHVKIEEDGGMDPELDRVEIIEESHFLHKQDAERTNAVLLGWLDECGFA